MAAMTDDVPAVPSASVLVLRDGPLEVLMIRRHAQASFGANAWVFPGGVTEALDRDVAKEIGDGSKLEAMRVSAVRELFEESGIWLGPPIADAETKRRRLLAGNLSFRAIITESKPQLERLVWTSHWITPVGVPKRFDTYFFLAEVPRDTVATVEHAEAVDVVWITPADALATLQLMFPTMKNLEAIAGFTSVRDLLASRRGVDVPTMRPVLVSDGGGKKIVLP